MPKITIKTLPVQPEIHIPDLLKRLGNQLSKTLDLPLNRLVILWEFILPNQFLFNGQVAPNQPGSTHHPIVEITALTGMSKEREIKMAQTIAREITCGLSIDPENICMVIRPVQPDRLLVTGKFPWEPGKPFEK
jgi:phenylpyruvate tautomerase PptA (4-oxalocrotonate tautomerase family)